MIHARSNAMCFLSNASNHRRHQNSENTFFLCAAAHRDIVNFILCHQYEHYANKQLGCVLDHLHTAQHVLVQCAEFKRGCSNCRDRIVYRREKMHSKYYASCRLIHCSFTTKMFTILSGCIIDALCL